MRFCIPRCRNISSLLSALVLFAVSSGCFKSTNEAPPFKPIESVPLANSNKVSGPLFQSLTAEQTGIDFTILWDKPAKYDLIFYSQINGGGVCVGDYDEDGKPDVYLTRPSGGNRLYRNLGNLKFEDVTEKTGLSDESYWGMGASFVDIDNDRDLDLYVCGYDCANRLYLNQGDGSFREAARQYALDYRGASVMMAFADYDNDGDLDGYLVTAGLMPPPDTKFRVRYEGERPVVRENLREYWDFLYLPGKRLKKISAGQYDHLFRNNGDGTFTDVSREAGITGTDLGQSATWWDYNADGNPDLYVANDYWGQDYLYRNNGDGTFTDIANEALPHTPWSSMGADFADINGDGRFDLLGSDMAMTSHRRSKITMGDMSDRAWFLEWAEPRQYMRNALYLNTGTERFMEVAHMTGLAKTDWTWSTRFEDFDNDGHVDLFVANGTARDFMDSDLTQKALSVAKEGSPEFFRFWMKQKVSKERNLAFKNLGNLQFKKVGPQWGLDRLGASFGAATGDLDGDGDLDLIVNNMDEPARVYRNRVADGNRIKIRLRGTISNRMGIGATVKITTTAGEQVRYLSHSRGWMSSSEPVVHFGLGDESTIKELKITWPSGHVQRFKNLNANRYFTLTEPNGKPPRREPVAEKPTMFVRSNAIPSIRHSETPYDDFLKEPLLPNKLSQLGPGLAVADIDGNGKDDIYLSGAAGQPGQFLVSRDAGSMSHRSLVQPDVASEEMSPLLFDVDGDGDQDAYVVSGGVEGHSNQSKVAGMLQDRLLLNDGHGNFRRAPAEMLPDAYDSGSVAVSADFDRDGDLDLFVGGRTVPGRYPETPTSRLLRNDGGTLVDVADDLAPGLRETGLVTGALWSDADGDGWLDLLVTHEWGPVKFWHNEKGKLTDHTKQAGLAGRLGWWNGIASGDVDHDGDIDYVVTNFGLNTKYHVTPEKPARIYFADFDGSGKKHIVEAKVAEKTVLPRRGRSCSSNAMPFLKDKFKTYHEFAGATLPEIYTQKSLSNALQREVNSLESGVLLNDGKATFTFVALPRLAQASPSFGVAVGDVDADSHPDIYLVQNFYSPQRETGRMDGSMSLLLKGDGKGGFSPIWPDQSGLIVPGDAKSLAVIDLNDDNHPDFVVGVNDDEVLAFENQTEGRHLAVRLKGKRGNPTAIGARVTLRLSNGQTQTAEVTAGGSYLSQSSPTLYFGLGQSEAEQVEVRWPDATITMHGPQKGGSLLLQHADLP